MASDYGQYAAETIAVPWIEGTLGCMLSKTEAAEVISICLRSPEAFRRVIDTNLKPALVRVADEFSKGVVDANTVLTYARAAHITDCADERTVLSPNAVA